MRANLPSPHTPKYLTCEKFIKAHKTLFDNEHYFPILMCAAKELSGDNREALVDALKATVNNSKFDNAMEKALIWYIQQMCFNIKWALDPYEEVPLGRIWEEILPIVVCPKMNRRMFGIYPGDVFEYMQSNPKIQSDINIRWNDDDIYMSPVMRK